MTVLFAYYGKLCHFPPLYCGQRHIARKLTPNIINMRKDHCKPKFERGKIVTGGGDVSTKHNYCGVVGLDQFGNNLETDNFANPTDLVVSRI